MYIAIRLLQILCYDILCFATMRYTTITTLGCANIAILQRYMARRILRVLYNTRLNYVMRCCTVLDMQYVALYLYAFKLFGLCYCVIQHCTALSEAHRSVNI
jgi:hypothetical protein